MYVVYVFEGNAPKNKRNNTSLQFTGGCSRRRVLMYFTTRFIKATKCLVVRILPGTASVKEGVTQGIKIMIKIFCLPKFQKVKRDSLVACPFLSQYWHLVIFLQVDRILFSISYYHFLSC